jgi:dTDP-4-dehydrorhamnose reductase
MASLQLWAGPECTVNRVGDAYFDQLDRTQHAHREGDLERIASLGIRRIRYPLLWERIAPDGPESARFEWSDDRLGRLRSLGIDPIVGLLHLGSGPRHTSLLDPGFPQALAAYARTIALRYPWVVHYTPINEPTTTARFKALSLPILCDTCGGYTDLPLFHW